MSDTIVGSPDDRRKREFRAALALEGITAREWAKQHGLWDTHLSRMVSGAYREDYAKGGYRILPLFDPSGERTALTILLWAAALIPATLSPALAMPGRLGMAYSAFAILSGGAYLYLCVKLARDHTRANARRVFLASIMHLPLLLVVMVADAVVTALL